MDRTLPATWRLPALDWHWLGRWSGVAGLVVIWLTLQASPFIGDAHGYWMAWHRPEMYGPQWNVDADAFVYPPPFALAIWPLAQLAWPIFYAVWSAVLLGVTAWLLGPLWAFLLLLPYEPLRHAVASGGVNILIAASVVVAVNHPPAWAFAALSKVTPSVGALYHLGRRDWWAFGVAIAVPLLLIAATLPWWSLWQAWIVAMLRGGPPLPEAFVQVPLLFRLPLAGMIALTAGGLQKPWLVPVAVWIALPNWSVVSSLTVLAAIPALLRGRLAGAGHHPETERRVADERAVGPDAL